MKREFLSVSYSYEHGDEKLPRLKDMVSSDPDPEKNIIVRYLETNCVMASPGIIYDEITPGKTIGVGNVFSDGTYFWDDVFINYVKRYNIPVPQEFRSHILQNYSPRMKRHTLLRLVDKVEIENNTHLGYKYHILIHRDGVIEYYNNTENKGGATISIKPNDAAYIIAPVMTELFCYDSDEHGEPATDGYHWKLTFFKKDKLISVLEGWPGEDSWRYQEVKRIMEFIEQFVPYALGAQHMHETD